MDERFAVALTVSGRVQGVGFRAYVSDLARGLDLAGEVWNTRQGNVEGFVQGDQTGIDKFLENLKPVREE